MNKGSYCRTISLRGSLSVLLVSSSLARGVEVFRDSDGNVNIADAVDMLNAFFEEELMPVTSFELKGGWAFLQR